MLRAPRNSHIDPIIVTYRPRDCHEMATSNPIPRKLYYVGLKGQGTALYVKCERAISIHISMTLYFFSFPRVFQTGHFRDGSDLVKTWDECQYLINEQKAERPMTSLTKYRIREK